MLILSFLGILFYFILDIDLFYKINFLLYYIPPPPPYDRNDKEEQKLIEDYYFYKNFVEVLRNDWKEFYFDRYDKEKYKIIIDNQAEPLFKRALDIHRDIYYSGYEKMPKYIFIDDIILARPEKCYKYHLINKFKSNKLYLLKYFLDKLYRLI